MKTEQIASQCREHWPSSKCQRILRPLKLKITALERALSTSYSVSDGLASWVTHVDQRKYRDNSGTESSSSYNPASSKMKKYGTARKHSAASRNRGGLLEPYVSADELLVSLRASVSPHLGSAYIGVYYAFRTILERVDSNETFPSLASRAALAVGRCIHLTGPQFTEDPIEADDWYEAAPSHLRAAVVLGHAVQTLISSCEILGPLLSILTLCMKQTPSAMQMLDAVLQSTSLLSCRKTDVHALQSLAEQIGSPWAIRAHVTRDFKIEYLGHAPFSVLLDSKDTGDLDDYTSALYIKSNNIAINHLRRRMGRDETRDLRTQDTLRDICQRVVRSGNSRLISCLGSMWSRTTDAQYIGLGAVYLLAALANKPEDTSLIQTINSISDNLVRYSSEDKQEVSRFVIDTFGTEGIVRIVELLVGRVDDLGITLAGHCAIYLQGEFVTWADGIRADIARARCDQDSDKYRFEPLLDSWVTRTPGLQKIKGRKIFTDVEDTEDDSLSMIEEDYDADQSRTQLSFVEIECEDEDDLLATFTSPQGKMGHNVLEILSAKKSSQEIQSARLLKRYGRVTSKLPSQKSPIACRSWHNSEAASQEVDASPLRSKRIYSDTEEDDDLSSQSLAVPLWRKKRKLSVGRAAVASSSPIVGRVKRNPLRELNNLKSSFADLRKRKKPRTKIPMGGQDDLWGNGSMLDGHFSSGLDEDMRTDIQEHPKSECDELSLL